MNNNNNNNNKQQNFIDDLDNISVVKTNNEKRFENNFVNSSNNNHSKVINNNPNKRSQTLNPNDLNINHYHVPIVPNNKKKKSNKKHIQIYLSDEMAPLLAAFIKKNQLGKTEAINYILKDFFQNKVKR